MPIAVEIIKNALEPMKRVRGETLAGDTVARLVERCAVPDSVHVLALLDDQPLADVRSCALVPVDGQVLRLVVVPEGGGGKNPLATILSIAVLVVATAATGGAFAAAGGAWFAAGSVSASMLGAGIAVGGMMLVNAIAPPPKPSLPQIGSDAGRSSMLNLQAARNRMAPYEPIPLVLGRFKVVPYYATPPYSEQEGPERSVRMLFIVGEGPLDITNIRIGQTPIEQLPIQVEVLQGYPGDDPPRLYSNTVIEDTAGLPIELTSGNPITRSTLNDVDEIGFEIQMPQLFRIDDNGNRQPTSVEFSARYRKVGDGGWKEFGILREMYQAWYLQSYGPPGLSYDEFDSYPRTRQDRVVIHKDTLRLSVLKGYTSFPYRAPSTPPDHYSLALLDYTGGNPVPVITDTRPALLTQTGAGNFAVSFEPGAAHPIGVAAGTFPSDSQVVTANSQSVVRRSETIHVPRGQYELEVTRITPDTTSDRLFNKSFLALIRNVRHINPVNRTGLALIALKAKESEELSGIMDQVNCEAQSIIPDWTGSAWVAQPTRNPASIVRWLLTDTKINPYAVPLSRIDDAEMIAWHQECNARGDVFGAILDYRTNIRELINRVASFGRGSLGIPDGVYAIIRDLDRQAQPAVHLIGPRNSWGYRCEKTFRRLPHALHVRYFDATRDYAHETLTVYADGFGPENASRFDTLPMDIAIDGHAQAYRFGRFHLAQMILRPEEHSVEMDIAYLLCTRGSIVRLTYDASLIGLRQARVKSTVVDLDDNITAVTCDESFILEPGKAYGVRFFTTEGAEHYRAVAWSGEVAEQTHTLTLSTTLPPNTIMPDDMATFGEAERETERMIVTQVEPMGDFKARVTMVAEAPAVHTSDTEAIPPFDPLVTIPPDIRQFKPAVPVIDSVVSDESALIVGPDGSLIERILVAVRVLPSAARASHIDVRFRRQGAATWRTLPRVSASVDRVDILDVVEGVSYEIQARAVSVYGVAGDWTASVFETVIGKTSAPPPPTLFLIRALPDGTREFTFGMGAEPLDLDGYQIRYRLGTGWTWDEMFPLHSGALKSSPWESNQLSAGQYVFAIKSRDTTGNLSTGALYVTTTLPDPRLAGVLDIIGEFGFGWLGTKTGCYVTEQGFLSANDSVTWAGLTTWSAWTRWMSIPVGPIVYEREFDIGAVAAFVPLVSLDADGTATIEQQHSTNGSSWSSWAAIGELVTARYLRVRVTLSGDWPLIREMTTIFSATPKVHEIEDLNTASLTGAYRIGTGEVRLPITGEWATIRTIFVTLQNTGPGWSWELIDKDMTTGPRIKIYNGSNAPADAVIDATIRGI